MASNPNTPQTDQALDNNESIFWVLRHKKMLQFAMEYRAVKLGLKTIQEFETTKATAAYQRLSPSTLLLIETIGENFCNLDATMMNEFQALLDKGIRKKIKSDQENSGNKESEQKNSADTEASEAEFDNSIKQFLFNSNNKSILDTLNSQRKHFEDNRKKAERWIAWVSDPAEVVSSFLHLGEDLPPPINLIIKPIRAGFTYLSHFADLQAMSYDPDLVGPQELGEKGSILGLISAASTIVGGVALILGGAAAGVALAPIAIFVGAAGICLSSLMTLVSNLRILVKKWEKEENEKSPWPRRWGMIANVVGNLSGAIFTAVVAVATFIAIANPIGLSIAGGLLFTWAAVTAGIALGSFIAKRIAEKEAEKQRITGLEGKDAKPPNQEDADKAKDVHGLKKDLTRVEQAFEHEVAEVAASTAKNNEKPANSSAIVTESHLHDHDHSLSEMSNHAGIKAMASDAKKASEKEHHVHVKPGGKEEHEK